MRAFRTNSPNSAGAAGNFLASIEQLSVNAFKSVMDIDVIGSYNTLKATLPYLVASGGKHRMDSETRKPKAPLFYPKSQILTSKIVQPAPGGTGGRIIFVSATLHYRGMPFQAHVSVAKAGIDSLSNSVAIEYGPRGVTSNIISPGPIAQTEVRLPTKNITTGLKIDDDSRDWIVWFHLTLWQPTQSPSLWAALVTFAILLMRPFISSLMLVAMLPVRPLLVSEPRFQ
jgi:NAD(P)-dependent dehydrogenase (short-subunit alcohol dehydrogenase family)